MELVSAGVAGRWAASAHPFTPWLSGYQARLGLAALRWGWAGLGCRVPCGCVTAAVGEPTCCALSAFAFPHCPPCLARYRSTYAVYRFPAGAAALSDAPGAFAGLALLGVATSFTGTLMLTALGSFFNRCVLLVLR